MPARHFNIVRLMNGGFRIAARTHTLGGRWVVDLRRACCKQLDVILDQPCATSFPEEVLPWAKTYRSRDAAKGISPAEKNGTGKGHRAGNEEYGPFREPRVMHTTVPYDPREERPTEK